MQVKTCPATVKAAGAHDGADEGVVEAIVAAYNVDSVGDRIIPGAFKNTLERRKASGSPFPFVWNHRSDDPESYVGEVIEAEERPEGLWVKARMDLDEPRALKVYKLLKGRRVTQFSFAYSEVDARPAAKTDDGARKDLHELDMFECGPTMLGCNQATALLDVKHQQPVNVTVHNVMPEHVRTRTEAPPPPVAVIDSAVGKSDIQRLTVTRGAGPSAKRSDMTARDLRTALDTALTAAVGGPGRYVWVRDYTDDWVVYSVDPDGPAADVEFGLYQRTYTVDAGVVTLTGESTAVVERTDYTPAPAAAVDVAVDVAVDAAKATTAVAKVADDIAELAKAGRTLSEANLRALTEALAQIQKVLGSAMPADPKKDDAETGAAKNSSSDEKATPAEPADAAASQVAPEAAPDAKSEQPAEHGTASARLRTDLALLAAEVDSLTL